MPQVYQPPAPQALRWVERQLGPSARVVRVERLHGGITAAMDRITVERDRPTDVVLRRWADAPWAPALVAREAEALGAIRHVDVAAPELIAADADGADAGVRCTLTRALDGEPELQPADMADWLTQLATAQAAIHTAPGPLSTTWDGWYTERWRDLKWIADRGLRDAARQAAAAPLENEQVVVHGDFQNFNVLWRGGRLTGVVDWPNAAWGRRGSDVGHCRLNLTVLFGPQVAVDYLTAYERAAGTRVDRVADLRALLCFYEEWLEFLPVQVAGRAPLDVAGMPDRVVAAVRAALDQ